MLHNKRKLFRVLLLLLLLPSSFIEYLALQQRQPVAVIQCLSPSSPCTRTRTGASGQNSIRLLGLDPRVLGVKPRASCVSCGASRLHETVPFPLGFKLAD